MKFRFAPSFNNLNCFKLVFFSEEVEEEEEEEVDEDVEDEETSNKDEL